MEEIIAKLEELEEKVLILEDRVTELEGIYKEGD